MQGIAQDEPALGVAGVKVSTFADWASGLRTAAFPWLEAAYEEALCIGFKT